MAKHHGYSDLLVRNLVCTKCGNHPHGKNTQWCRPCINEYLKVKRLADGPKPRTEIQKMKRARRNKIYLLVATGKLERKPCEICGNLKSEGHHHNGYDASMAHDVRWMCREHHSALERWEKKYLTESGMRITPLAA